VGGKRGSSKWWLVVVAVVVGGLELKPVLAINATPA
jgi:hypothetical protein